jgi:transcriptional regulator with XRE-family HTH domain
MIDEQSMEANAAELARILKAARNAKGWTLRQVAAQTGISNGYLSLIEQGDVQSPAPRYLHALADRYQLAFDQLMALAGHPSGPSAVRSDQSRVASAPAGPVHGLLGGANEPSSHASGTDSSSGGADQVASPSVVRKPALAQFGDDRRVHAPNADERTQLTDLVLDDMRVLSTADIAQVRAFIAGLRAARRT